MQLLFACIKYLQALVTGCHYSFIKGTGPAPPEGVGPPTFLRVSATSAVVNLPPPD